MIVKLDLHIHSSASHDGRMGLEEIVRTARAAQLNGIAICDHDVLRTDLPNYDDLAVIPGCEFSTECGHLLGLFLHEPIPKLSFADTVAAIHAQGGLAVLAHPFERSRDERRLTELVPMLDGIEVWNGRAERKIRDANKRALDFCMASGLRQFAGSDAHLPGEIGNGVVTLEADSLSLTDLRTALMRSPVTVTGCRGRALSVARSQFTKLKKRRAGAAAFAKWMLFAGKCAVEDCFAWRDQRCQ